MVTGGRAVGGDSLRFQNTLLRTSAEVFLANPEALDLYVDSLAGTSPRNRPERFPTPADALAYWLNAWHALVLQQVVDRAPLSSAWRHRRRCRSSGS